MLHHFFVTAAKGLVPLLRDELESLELSGLMEGKGGVSFDGSLEQGYRVCLWSRTANRVLLQLDCFSCPSSQSLYEGVGRSDWSKHMAAESSFAVRFSGTSPALRNSHFSALKVKDAIVDQFRGRCGQRPNVSTERPDVQVSVYLNNNVAVLYIDLSGDSLHKRAYRSRGGEAPLKENLAAAILIKAKWAEIAIQGGDFLDPMCGSGTLLVEAALIAGDIAPGLKRDYFGFLGWKGHDSVIWTALRENALQRKERSAAKIPLITGYDINPRAVRIASENIHNAGLQDFIQIERRPICDARPPVKSRSPGLIAVNPPYGERMGANQRLETLYSDFGKVLKSDFEGWRVALLIGDSELGFKLGIRSRRPYTLYNGAIECKLLVFEIDPDRFFMPKNPVYKPRCNDLAQDSLIERARYVPTTGKSQAGMLANRLRKNLRKFRRWIDREGITCYRLYDADIPEYAMAIDLYRGRLCWVHVQEYQAPCGIDPEKAEHRLLDAIAVLPEILGVDWEQIFLKVRRRQKGTSQYERQEIQGEFYQIEEAGHRFQVNFESYLDTGLFLDHRMTRSYIEQNARDCRFLNLFGYTGTATVYAAAGGAISTTTVDLSKTYLDWARKNLALNGFESAVHNLVQADVLAWISQALETGGQKGRFGLIFLDPPTFSNSKSMERNFDIQRDHAALIEQTVQLLTPGGILVFSTNYRKFRLEEDRFKGLRMADISRQTLPRDFERNPKIHRCWEIRRE